MNIMQHDTQNAFLKTVERKLNEILVQTNMLSNEGSPQIGNTLRLLLPFDEGTHCLVVSVSVYNMNEEAVLLDFYTVLLTELGDTLPALRNELISWNYFCPLGSFGIYERGREFYHKYGIILYENAYKDMDNLAEYTTNLLTMLYQVVSEKFAPALDILQGKAKFF